MIHPKNGLDRPPGRLFFFQNRFLQLLLYDLVYLYHQKQTTAAQLNRSEESPKPFLQPAPAEMVQYSHSKNS